MQEFQENGSVSCLLEFKPNFLLSGNGDNKNNINLRKLEEEKFFVEFN